MDALSKLKALQGHAFEGEMSRMEKGSVYIVNQRHEILPNDFGTAQGSTAVEPPVPTLSLEKPKEKKGNEERLDFINPLMSWH